MHTAGRELMGILSQPLRAALTFWGDQLPDNTPFVLLNCRSWAADNPADFYKLYGLARANYLYLLIYMALVILFVMLLLVRDSTFSLWSKRAGTNLHNKLFRRVLAAPILFFLRTPVGDVLNAFARDQVRLDLGRVDWGHGIFLQGMIASYCLPSHKYTQ